MYEVTMYNHFDRKFTAILDDCHINLLLNKILMNFRNVEVIDTETGELMYSHYISDEWFNSPCDENDEEIMLSLIFD